LLRAAALAHRARRQPTARRDRRERRDAARRDCERPRGLHRRRAQRHVVARGRAIRARGRVAADRARGRPFQPSVRREARRVTTAHDVIVLGAGVAGAAAAAWLAGAGWSVALVERRAFPRRKVCGECVAAPNLPLLDALGIGAAAAALAGPPLRRVALDAGDERIEADLPRPADPRHPWGRALAREHLDRLLADRAAELGAIRWQPWTATAVR